MPAPLCPCGASAMVWFNLVLRCARCAYVEFGSRPASEYLRLERVPEKGSR